LLFAFNFCPNEYKGFHVEVPENSKWEEIFSTDEERFGGSGWYKNGTRESWKEGDSSFAAVDLAPLSAAIFKLV
ncbi:MAG: alpha amylase C-terminal domain-containing protein, partial [Oscillospiraceae bacterium]|nr:alpha amylase C-terminal domain-containing protein [Oscillospiraceae bacterium]